MGFDQEFSFPLFARPSFWEGVGRTLDIGGTFDSYNVSKMDVEADARALSADWRAVGSDISTALDEYGKEVKRKVAA